MQALPSNLILSEAERDEVERHIRVLDAACGPTPADDPETEGAMLIDLTKLMLVLPAPKQNEASAEARGEAYLAALDDVPLWALRSAIRRWYRGDAGTNERGEPFDYHWCPAPAELRKIAMSELWRVGGINPWRLGGALPRRAFARKISKLKTKSPMRKNVANLSFDRGFEGAQLCRWDMAYAAPRAYPQIPENFFLVVDAHDSSAADDCCGEVSRSNRGSFLVARSNAGGNRARGR
jgi:hypothetical protein